MIYKVTITDNELNSLVNLPDISVRSGGLRVSKDALQIISRLESAEKIEEVPIEEN